MSNGFHLPSQSIQRPAALSGFILCHFSARWKRVYFQTRYLKQ